MEEIQKPPKGEAGASVTAVAPALDRFEIRRQLGVGGMGVVYYAWDRERQMHVALKTLREVDPAAIYRFKREFRALTDVSHPNLVSLYELLSSDNQWLFTMELIHGVDFVSYVRGASPSLHVATLPIQSDVSPALTGMAQGTSEAETRTHGTSRRELPLLDIARLRHGLAQLTDGICALHDSGQLHRDIKPSNVLVTGDERVVLLDFGVITELAGRQWQSERASEVVGTPAYVAPEQAEGNPVAASDWYSVGVMLYEALTGHRPFEGPSADLLERKKTLIPQPPSMLRKETPADLDALCMKLLETRPERRPDDAEIRARLGLPPRRHSGASSAARAEALLGRDEALAQLHEALATSRDGAIVVSVHGTSGMGKSALVSKFLDQASGERGAVVLAGRCYERESMPYKAVDSLIDNLSRFLLALPREEAAKLVPPTVAMLARVFPVLRRVPAVTEAPRAMSWPDPQELRRQAFAALRELLGRIARSRPLILFIDDLQWGDVDSAPLLEALVRPPEPPPLLVVGVYRSEEAERSPFLQALLPLQRRLAHDERVRTITVGALSADEAIELAGALLRARGLDASPAEVIARESNGTPFFVHELVRFAESGEGARGAALSLEGVIRARISQLPEMARRLLELIAVASARLSQRVLQAAAQITVDQRFALLQQLRAAHMVNATGADDGDLVEVYHDRIRETMLASLDRETVRTHHLRLASAFQREPHPDPQTLTFHLAAAGAHAAAAEFAAVAADQAAETLAFNRAVQLYRLALELGGDEDAAARRHLAERLGDALANAGRGAEAAGAYLVAADGAAADVGLEMRRRAGLQYLRSGHIDEGLATLRDVLGAVGEQPPTSKLSAIGSALLRRTLVRLRGLRFRAREPAEIPPGDLARIDACWSAAVGMSMVDPISAADLGGRQLLLSLRCGEPYRITRSLAFEIGFSSLGGPRTRKRADRIVAKAQELVEQLRQPELYAFVHGGAALVEYQNGCFGRAREHAIVGARFLRENATGVAWEITSIDSYLLWSLYQLGSLGELSVRVHVLLDEALQRGDRYGAASLRVGLPNIAWLVTDQPDEARRQIETSIREWSSRDFYLQHHWGLLAHVNCDLYLGQGEAALERVRAVWQTLRRSMLMRIQAVRVEAFHLRARASLAAAAGAADPAPLLRDAERDARRLAREPVAWSRALATLVRAGAMAARGRTEEASALFAAGAEQCDAAEMALLAAIAGYRAAELTGDRTDPRLAAGAAALAAERVADPERLMAALVPCPRPRRLLAAR